PEMGAQLAQEAAAVDWFRDAYGHLKAIAACKGSQPIVQAAGIVADAGVVDPKDIAAFIAAAKTRQWEREPKLRTLA
ncbi:MAG TPA: catalase HPII, partial [Burkholderiaceae bacterium]